MKNKKALIITLLIILIIAIAIVGGIIYSNTPKENAQQVLAKYISLINEKKYEELYSILSTESKNNISEDDFVTRNKNIYEGIDAVNIKVQVQNEEKQGKTSKITYNETMSTSAGDISFDNTVNLVIEDKEYKINWSSSMIFPELRDTDKVRVSTIESKRGEILDRNGNKLAENGSISSIGIVPGKLSENKEQDIQKISELTGVSVDYINNQLSQSWVTDDTFVPIKKVSTSETNLKEQLLQISGIQINSTNARVYPLGNEAAHLIGYVQTINAEELEQNAGKGYSSTSLIGKAGLEAAYEDRLRGIDGTEIYIQDAEGNKLKTLAKQDKKDGEDIKITIDSTLQKEVYEQMKNDKGLWIIMEPTTGEILTAVSTPTYDSNDFVLGLSTDEWNQLNNDTSKPLYNRFLQRYCPGSTFKPITAAIGLTTGKITTDTTVSYSGKSWQKDSSWGNYNVTTLTAYNGPKNVANALLYSDNIFFAQTALQIGKEQLTENLKNIGFGESLDFPLTLAQSQYSSSEDGQISTEIKLADTGYGQGDLLVNPIHMASIYSSFANGGNMVKPYIEYNEGKAEYYKQNVFTQQAAETVKNDLIQVVENPSGTAHDMQIQGLTIAGKTGTAELKTSSEDTESGTLGWFNCFTVGRSQGDLLMVGMVENTQNNADGGSHYIISKMKAILQ
mgnify:FL=1